MFSCDFLALQYRTLSAASSTWPRTPTNITFNQSMSLQLRRGVESCAISTTYSLYLFIQFLSQILALTDNKISHQLALNLIPGSQHVLYLDRCIFGTFCPVWNIYSCDGILSMWINKASSRGKVFYAILPKCWMSGARESFCSVGQRSRLRETFCDGARERAAAQAGANDQSVCSSALLSSWDVESRQCLKTQILSKSVNLIFVLACSGNKPEVFRPPLMDWCEIGIGFWILGKRWDQSR